ncbi:MAG: aspartoacylase [Cyanobacteria bacterium J06621_8]
MVKINQVLLSAGIHGNEKTGIYLIKKLQNASALISRNSFTPQTLLANHKAIELNQRYYEIDLNRCFAATKIDNKPQLYEEQLAQKIYRHVKESQVDFVLDFHTTTANMGLTLMLTSDRPLNLQLAAYLAATNPLIKIVRSDQGLYQNRFRHLFPLGFTVEMGAVAPNVIDPVWFSRAEQLVMQILDYIEKTNQGNQPPSPKNILVYSMSEPIYFPTDYQGEIAGMVTPELHGNDYSPIQPGEIIFKRFDGENIAYQGKNITHPIFINETAYWEKKIAMYSTTRENKDVPAVS